MAQCFGLSVRRDRQVWAGELANVSGHIQELLLPVFANAGCEEINTCFNEGCLHLVQRYTSSRVPFLIGQA